MKGLLEIYDEETENRHFINVANIDWFSANGLVGTNRWSVTFWFGQKHLCMVQRDIKDYNGLIETLKGLF